MRATLTVFQLTGDPQLVEQLLRARAREHEALMRFVRSELERVLPRDSALVASVLATWPGAPSLGEPVGAC